MFINSWMILLRKFKLNPNGFIQHKWNLVSRKCSRIYENQIKTQNELFFELHAFISETNPAIDNIS